MRHVFTATTIIGDVTDLADCQVMKRDPITNLLVPTNETIEVHQVDHGIKLVEAQTLEGAIFGLGFIHAKDRLWQLDFYRRLAQGRLSEVFGPETVAVDKYVRLIGLPRAIEEHMKHIKQADIDLTSNYAAGINKVVDNIVVYPPEF